ncbi:hypothetical protein CYMTET_10071, partial [Cymbomonas tetramitiformis]
NQGLWNSLRGALTTKAFTLEGLARDNASQQKARVQKAEVISEPQANVSFGEHSVLQQEQTGHTIAAFAETSSQSTPEISVAQEGHATEAASLDTFHGGHHAQQTGSAEPIPTSPPCHVLHRVSPTTVRLGQDSASCRLEPPSGKGTRERLPEKRRRTLRLSSAGQKFGEKQLLNSDSLADTPSVISDFNSSFHGTLSKLVLLDHQTDAHRPAALDTWLANSMNMRHMRSTKRASQMSSGRQSELHLLDSCLPPPNTALGGNMQSAVRWDAPRSAQVAQLTTPPRHARSSLRRKPDRPAFGDAGPVMESLKQEPGLSDMLLHTSASANVPITAQGSPSAPFDFRGAEAELPKSKTMVGQILNSDNLFWRAPSLVEQRSMAADYYRDTIDRVRTFFRDDTPQGAAKTELMKQLKNGAGHVKPVALCQALGINVLRLQACIPIMDMTMAVLNCDAEKPALNRVTKAFSSKISMSRSASLCQLQGHFEGEEYIPSEEVMDQVSQSLRTLGQTMSRRDMICMAKFIELASLEEEATHKELLEALTFERLLGTALVHSYLHANRLVRFEEMTKQAALAEMVPWEKSTERLFTWYVTVMVEIMHYVKNDGWYRRSKLFNLVFLQSSNGCYQMTQTLANILHAGQPEQALSEQVVIPTFSLENLIESVPQELPVLCRHDRTLAQQVWATLCAAACYDLVPFEWVHNPLAGQVESQTLGERALSWVAEMSADRGLPMLLSELPELQAVARRLVERWEEEQSDRVEAFYLRAHKGTSASSLTPRTLPVWLGSAVISLLKLAFRTHPLAQIFMTVSTDPFTRSERIILQTTMFFMMLFFSMAFYYSRARGCCLMLQEFLSCPLDMAAGDDTAACVGTTSCIALYNSWDSDLLPVELMQDSSSYTCNAFPAPTWIGRLEAVMTMVACLLPINALLSSLFGMSNASKMATYWRPAPHKQRFKMKQTLSWVIPVMQAIGFALYGMLINVQLLNKALAMLLLLTINVTGNPVSRIKDTISWVHAMLTKGKKAYFQTTSIKRSDTRLEGNGPKTLTSLRSGYVELWTSWLAFFLVGMMWAMGIWVLLTYGMLIRRMMGVEEETTMLATFGYGLLMEQFGLEAAKLVVLRVIVAKAINYLTALVNSHAPMQHWYEHKVNKFLTKQLARDGIINQDDDDEEEFSEAVHQMEVAM